MGLEVGSIVEGRVTGITKFGAFVALPGGKSGLVHISEVANSFVSDVHDHVQMGQTVKVRILTVSDDGKINLSIKRAQPRPQQQGRPQPRPAQKAPVRRDPLPGMGEVLPPSDDRAFEDKLKAFMSESDSKMAGIRQYEHRTKSRRR